jgi:ABC-type methionine transport system permease subunit
MFQILINALGETLKMVISASAITLILGIPLGILTAAITRSQNRLVVALHYALLTIIRVAQITPYLLIMILFIPLSNWFIDHHITYANATIIPLATAGVLLLANKVYNSMATLSEQWHATAKIMGASAPQTLWLILLPEALPQIISSAATICSAMVGYSAIAGALGAGGLGQLAIESSINNPNPSIVIASVAILLLLQQAILYSGNLVAIQSETK